MSTTTARRVRLAASSPLIRNFSMTATNGQGRPPYPPFTAETAHIKVKAAQDAWNTRDPAKVKMAYTEDSIWRNRDQFLQGRDAIEAFLTRKWQRERHYRLRKELFSFGSSSSPGGDGNGDRIAVQFWYEWYEAAEANEGSGGGGRWWRTYGLEDWTFAADGLMRKRQMSGNDVPIAEGERWFPPEVEDVNTVEISEKHW
ncbi:DUF1348-domain-containing protein [Xylariaceae sp. FL0804]|nr:DUF1348-domain-containing protein [Xylariaceae sp. FL0804]